LAPGLFCGAELLPELPFEAVEFPFAPVGGGVLAHGVALGVFGVPCVVPVGDPVAEVGGGRVLCGSGGCACVGGAVDEGACGVVPGLACAVAPVGGFTAGVVPCPTVPVGGGGGAFRAVLCAITRLGAIAQLAQLSMRTNIENRTVMGTSFRFSLRMQSGWLGCSACFLSVSNCGRTGSYPVDAVVMSNKNQMEREFADISAYWLNLFGEMS
jgi:hypothetical protein